MSYIITFLGSFTVSSALLFIFQRFIVNTLAEKQKQENRVFLTEMQNQYATTLEDVKKKHQKELEDYKLNLNNYTRYSSEQFKLYNTLYASLYDLKNTADILWGRATYNNLISFITQLKKTKEELEKSVLLVEEDHYQELLNILSVFSEFQIGKTRLIELSEERYNSSTIAQSFIEHLIKENETYKRRYERLIQNIAQSFKSHVYYSNPNNLK